MDSTALSDRGATEAVDGVFLTQLAAGERMSVQHFHIEPGATVPEHSHRHEQAGFVYASALTFLVDGEEFVIEENDSYSVPGGEPHAAENRTDDPVRGIDVFSPPRTDPDWRD
ncbi:cupin domain-containing protein [halophilic archaeon]|nr:cupin domain-containing protein [halophilic archaeon]